MAPLPDHRPAQLSVGPLEQEILTILWTLNSATAPMIHEHILADPDRDLAYSSVTTVLQRLVQKGWVRCDRQERPFRWVPLVSGNEADLLRSHSQMEKFLAISNPDIVAAFADSVDADTVDQLSAIVDRLRASRQDSSGDAVNPKAQTDQQAER